MSKERKVARVRMALTAEKYVLFEVVKDSLFSDLPACKHLVHFLPVKV